MSEDYLRNNWVARPSLETRWETEVVPSASTQAECRRQILTRPQRTLEFTVTALDTPQISRLVASLYRMSSQNFDLPLYPDVLVVTADSSGTTLNVIPADRRYFVGHDLVILPWDGGGSYLSPVVKIIAVVNPSDIQISGSFASVVPKGSLVFPVFKASKILGAGLQWLRHGVANWEGVAFERPGDLISLPESHDYTPPSAAPQHESLPILDIGDLTHDWADGAELTYTREGEVFTQGRDLLVNVVPAKGKWTFTYNFLFSSRETRGKFTKLLELFDSRRGRLLPFWAVAPVDFFELIGLTTTIATITASFDLADFAAITHVALVLKDGTIYIREHGGIVLSGSDYDITFLSAIPATTLAEVEYFTIAAKSRFLNDTLREVWQNDGTCFISLQTIELIGENDNEVTDVNYVPGTEYTSC